MLSSFVIKAITLILVLSNILEIEAETAIKCFQNSDEDSKDPNKVPTSTACETSTHFCKNETSDVGTRFSCSALGNDVTEGDLPKCVDNTCYCKKDDCNAKDPKIKCPVGSDKTEKECQPGIVNCKNTTTTADGEATTVHACGNMKADQEMKCTGDDTKVCYFKPMVDAPKSSSSRPFIFGYLVQSLVGMLFALNKFC